MHKINIYIKYEVKTFQLVMNYLLVYKYYVYVFK